MKRRNVIAFNGGGHSIVERGVHAIIVGAGAAGLLAARQLARAGCAVVVLEARDRPGGRILTIDGRAALVPIELGAEFVHGTPAITLALLREAGIAVVDNARETFAPQHGKLAALDGAPFEAAAAVLARGLERDEDESVEALIARTALAEPSLGDAADWARRLVRGFDAADPARASARAIAQEWAGEAGADRTQSRPIAGYAALVAHLVRSLDPLRVRIVYNAIVRRVVRANGVTVEALCDRTPAAFEARFAIVTVPLGVLQQPAGGGAILFEPPLPATTRSAVAGLAMGPVLKVVLQFRHAFWEKLENGRFCNGAFFQSSGPFATYWTQLPVRARTLVAWAGGPCAAGLAQHEERDLVRLALDGAGVLFGDPRAAKEAYETGYVHDWQRDPYARGAYSYVAVGGSGARATLAQPVDDVLFFAGEATAREVEGGTVAGALESGERVARAVVAAARC